MSTYKEKSDYILSEYKIYKIPFTSKNYLKKESKNKWFFKGNIYVFIGIDNLVYNWIVKFDEISLDCFYTPIWKENKNHNYLIREKLFKRLNIEQLPRPSIKDNMIKHLNKEEVNIVNNFINENYDSTLKNLTALIKGNNPTGSLLKPEASEIIAFNNEKRIYNLIMFLDRISLIKKRKGLMTLKDIFNIEQEDFINALYNAENKNIILKVEDCINLYTKDTDVYFKNYFVKLNNSDYYEGKRITNSQSIKRAKEIINKFAKKISLTYKIDQICKEEEGKYHKHKIDFNATFNNCWDKMEEAAHIYNRKDIKKEMVKEAIKYDVFSDDKNSDKHLKIILNNIKIIGKQISDPNNLLNLDKTMHGYFDDNYFTYDENGKLISLKDNIKFENFLNKFDYYKQIPLQKLNENRKKYIKLRNENIKNK